MRVWDINSGELFVIFLIVSLALTIWGARLVLKSDKRGGFLTQVFSQLGVGIATSSIITATLLISTSKKELLDLKLGFSILGVCQFSTLIFLVFAHVLLVRDKQE